jgi:hypothetical protein
MEKTVFLKYRNDGKIKYGGYFGKILKFFFVKKHYPIHPDIKTMLPRN